ncbi:MAG: NERD domain-containing protein [Gammaproteobacteria bacterium]|nr:NERD domain-containing protein [Gammaproteobacteria bacterium]MBV9697715.1 NERD domain-containing protein [Gammaproteobacteria bacterium]
MQELGKLTPTAWLLIGCAVVLGFGLSLAWRWYRQYRARKALRAAVTGGALEHLVDSLVPDGMGGGFHVDYLLLTRRGVVVIDLRDVRGNIFGGDQMADWTVMDGPRRFTFTNPQGALYDRIAAVKAIAGELPVEGRIVFTRRGRFPKGLPKWTLMIDALRDELAGESEPPPESAAAVREAWQRLREAVRPSNMVDMR